MIACLDLEGVLIPEIWVAVAEHTGVEALRRTTREEPDYDRLMKGRLAILEQEGLGLSDLERAIDQLEPLPGALTFLDWLRPRMPIVVLSDTFLEFARPLLHKLGFPALFCHALQIDGNRVIGYRLRMHDHKREAVLAFRSLHLRTIAIGDSYNDVSMLAAAHEGILYRPTEPMRARFPYFRVAQDYRELRWKVEDALVRLA